MQVLYEEPDRYRMEFRQGTADDHFHVAEIPLQEAHEILAAYACGLPRWREAADWRPLNEEPGHLSAGEADAVEQRRPLYISSVVGGEARDDVLEAIRRLAVLVRQADAASTEQLAEGEAAVDLLFHVPGSLSRPDYEGMRTGRWFKAHRVLVVQVAVPEALSTDPAAVDAFVGGALRSAVSLAREVLAKRKLDFSLERAGSQAERAAAALLSNGSR